jgi:hypothetical protein
MYRGIQQVPLVLTGTALVFTVASGSMAFMNLTIGLGILMPLYAFISQSLVRFIFSRLAPGSIFWTHSTSDVCNIIPTYGKKELLYFTGSDAGEALPSYWLMSLGFFIGYAISNAVDSLTSPAPNESNTNSYEKRNTQAIFTIVAVSIFSALLLGIRFYIMSGCEGRAWQGILISILFAGGAAGIGNGIYRVSRICGAKASDLFGILSQTLPPSATSKNPVVCTAT